MYVYTYIYQRNFLFECFCNFALNLMSNNGIEYYYNEYLSQYGSQPNKPKQLISFAKKYGDSSLKYLQVKQFLDIKYNNNNGGLSPPVPMMNKNHGSQSFDPSRNVSNKKLKKKKKKQRQSVPPKSYSVAPNNILTGNNNYGYNNNDPRQTFPSNHVYSNSNYSSNANMFGVQLRSTNMIAKAMSTSPPAYGYGYPPNNGFQMNFIPPPGPPPNNIGGSVTNIHMASNNNNNFNNNNGYNGNIHHSHSKTFHGKNFYTKPLPKAPNKNISKTPTTTLKKNESKFKFKRKSKVTFIPPAPKKIERKVNDNYIQFNNGNFSSSQSLSTDNNSYTRNNYNSPSPSPSPKQNNVSYDMYSSKPSNHINNSVGNIPYTNNNYNNVSSPKSVKSDSDTSQKIVKPVKKKKRHKRGDSRLTRNSITIVWDKITRGLNEDIIKEQALNNNCSSIKKCGCVQRIGCVMGMYQKWCQNRDKSMASIKCIYSCM